MLSRRSLLRGLGAIIAAVALALEIAFTRKLALPVAVAPPLDLQEMFCLVYDLAKKRKLVSTIDIYTDSVGVKALEAQLGISHYAVEWGVGKPGEDIVIENWNEPVGILEQLRAAQSC